MHAIAAAKSLPSPARGPLGEVRTSSGKAATHSLCDAPRPMHCKYALLQYFASNCMECSFPTSALASEEPGVSYTAADRSGGMATFGMLGDMAAAAEGKARGKRRDLK